MVQPYYDSLVAKLIVHGRDREHAIQRMLWAMDEFIVEGIRTSLPLQRELMQEPAFRDLDYFTKYVDGWLARRAAKGSAAGE
jgi:acetyl-CoA carboxylase biotin carboxylase subunit